MTNMCRDMDLLRDQGVAVNVLQEETHATRDWELICPSCSSQVDEESIELRLMDEAYKLSTSFLLQDLRCPESHQVALNGFNLNAVDFIVEPPLACRFQFGIVLQSPHHRNPWRWTFL